MQVETPHVDPPWHRLVGRWAIEATHPALPGEVVRGQATFEWWDDQRVLVQRSHYDHSKIPDAIAVTSIVDRAWTMHYFDPRGMHRVFAMELTTSTWRFWNEDPLFAQRYTHVFNDDVTVLEGHGELSRDGAQWQPDLAITYRRIA